MKFFRYSAADCGEMLAAPTALGIEPCPIRVLLHAIPACPRMQGPDVVMSGLPPLSRRISTVDAFVVDPWVNAQRSTSASTYAALAANDWAPHWLPKMSMPEPPMG